MIVVDASIIVGLLRREVDVLPLAPLLRSSRCTIGAPTLAECLAWCAAHLDGGTSPWLEAWSSRRNVEVAPFDRRMAFIAHEAFRRFGRASGHAARLNFGDALAYAVAMTIEAPLLFKGADFGRTDVPSHPKAIRL